MTDRIPLAGVVGHPIAHSRSPDLFSFWLRKYGLPGHYVPMDVSQADLADVLKMMPRMGFVGCNVTIPHKEKVLEIADGVTDRAALVGAANTLIFRDDGRVHADNTDGYGFMENLRGAAPDWSANIGPAAVFGAGGAARAVIAALLGAGVPEIRLSNRTKGRAEGLRQEFGSRVIVYDWVHAGNMLEDATTVVNASSLGMTGKAEFRVPMDGLMSGAVVSDLVYSPLDTSFLQRARDLGGRSVDGLGMLLHQAVPGFHRWFGVRPEVDETSRRVLIDA